MADRVAWLMALAEATGMVGEMAPPLPGATLDMDFARGRYFGKPLNALTVERASIATDLLFDDIHATSYTTYAANIPVIASGKGLLLFEGRTQFLATPVAPGAVTQTMTLTAGTYTAWVLGPLGSVGTIAAGTGAATGLGNALPGAPKTFVVGTAGTFAFTTTAFVTYAQVENGLDPTSFMPSQMTRAASSVTLGGTAFTDIFSGLTGATISNRRDPADVDGV